MVGTAGGAMLLRGTGASNFTTSADFAPGAATTALASGDFDGNGALDVAVASADGNVTVLFGCP